MSTTSTAANKGSYTTSILIIGMLFFIFGFVTWLNGALIPFLKLACDLKTDTQALLVTFAFYMAYFFLALPSSFILEKTGFKNGMALGLLVMALGSVIFIPAAQSRSFALFLTGLFVQGAGLSLLQTASNPYISVIGPIESAAQRISIMGICNKVAGALSPIILGVVVLKGANEISAQVANAQSAMQKAELLDNLAARVITPYTVMAVILALLALMIQRSSLPEINLDENVGDNADTALSKGKTSVFQFPNLLMGVLGIFCFVGAEVMAADVITLYGQKLGFLPDTSKFFTTFTLLAMLLGYVIGIVTIPKYISQETSLKYGAILGIALIAGAFFLNGKAAVTCIALLGLANAPMWPAIFPLGIRGLGRFTKTGSAMLIMGIAGGALIPMIYGNLSEIIGFRLAFMLTLLPCYAYILFFALKEGRRARFFA
jgi:MFS transporter, FHS family, L-fucose permease